MVSLRSADLLFLTRNGCVNTPKMRANLNEALQELNESLDYTVLDLGALGDSDERRGYPTPSVLYGRRDLFGMHVPQPPFPEPG